VTHAAAIAKGLAEAVRQWLASPLGDS